MRVLRFLREDEGGSEVRVVRVLSRMGGKLGLSGPIFYSSTQLITQSILHYTNQYNLSTSYESLINHLHYIKDAPLLSSHQAIIIFSSSPLRAHKLETKLWVLPPTTLSYFSQFLLTSFISYGSTKKLVYN